MDHSIVSSVGACGTGQAQVVARISIASSAPPQPGTTRSEQATPLAVPAEALTATNPVQSVGSGFGAGVVLSSSTSVAAKPSHSPSIVHGAGRCTA